LCLKFDKWFGTTKIFAFFTLILLSAAVWYVTSSVFLGTYGHEFNTYDANIYEYLEKVFYTNWDEGTFDIVSLPEDIEFSEFSHSSSEVRFSLVHKGHTCNVDHHIDVEIKEGIPTITYLTSEEYLLVSQNTLKFLGILWALILLVLMLGGWLLVSNILFVVFALLDIILAFLRGLADIAKAFAELAEAETTELDESDEMDGEETAEEDEAAGEETTEEDEGETLASGEDNS
jgi:hypothetical protein